MSNFFDRVVSSFKDRYENLRLIVRTRRTQITALKLVFPSIKIAFQIYETLLKCSNPQVFIIVLTQHIGDLVACEPISRQLKSEYPDCKVIWAVNGKYKTIVQLHEFVDQIISLSCICHWKFVEVLLRSHRLTVYNLHFDRALCFKHLITLRNKNKLVSYDNYYNYGNLLQSMTSHAGLYPMDIRPELRVPDVDVHIPFKNFIVIQTQSNEPCRNWPIDNWKKLLAEFSDIQFIEVGLIPTLVDVQNCYTGFCGALSLDQSFYLISQASGFWGIDSGMAHVANAYRIKSMILLGTYKHFDIYNPFSGIQDNANFTIVRCSQPVAELGYESVFENAKLFFDNL